MLALAALAGGQALEALRILRDGAPDPSGRGAALAAAAAAILGDIPAAESQLARAERQLERPLQTDLVRPYLVMGRTDRANQVIQKAIEQRNANLLELLADPQLPSFDRSGVLQAALKDLRRQSR
jgi:hypothetical protein